MPRKPGHTDTHPLLRANLRRQRQPLTDAEMRELPASFYRAVVFGLLERLEISRSKDTWVRRALPFMGRYFRRLANGFGEDIASITIQDLVREKPTPRSRSIPCDPLRLYEHYQIASEHFSDFDPKGFRWSSGMRLSITEQATLLFKKLVTPENKCCCHCSVEVPQGLGAWLSRWDSETGRRRLCTRRDLIYYLLASHHGTSESTLRKYLEAASRQLKSYPPNPLDTALSQIRPR